MLVRNLHFVDIFEHELDERTTIQDILLFFLEEHFFEIVKKEISTQSSLGKLFKFDKFVTIYIFKIQNTIYQLFVKFVICIKLSCFRILGLNLNML